MKKEYVVFYDSKGKELYAYTLNETFEGEFENTIDLIAYENNLEPKEIKAQIEKR